MKPAVLVFLALAAQAVPPRQFFTTPPPLDEMRDKQAVVETSLGEFVIDLLPDAAPNHVGLFIKHASEGAYDSTTFHLAVRHGIVQGGDPVSRDPSQRDRYGTGGLRMLQAEVNDEPSTRGAVSAVLVPGDPDSAGAQFFVNVTDQPALQGKYTTFGRVVEGIEVVTRISEQPVDAANKLLERVEIRRVTIRARPPEPFSTETPAELAGFRAVLETSLGSITVSFLPEKAPGHVRHFLRMGQAGVLDGTAFHRVAPGFVIQTGFLPTRQSPLTQAQQRVVRTIEPEFNDTTHVRGTVSMARGDDPASASTSFFICLGPAPALDGQYTAFGRVTDGLDVVGAIEQVPRDGEAPLARVELVRVRIER